jgi:transcriptional regulator of arginine metabolism
VNIYAVEKPRRHERVLTLIRKGSVASQEQLAELLRTDGIRVTQATLSRDLRELGVMKGPTGYIVPGPGRASALALEIDRAGFRSVLGTVAGDDTIFVATRTPRDAARLLSTFKHLAGIA